jgi:guanine deaminase
MQFLGDYAKQNNLLIQSHISENLSEIEWVKGLHTDCDGYGDVYQKYGLLTENSIMAHSIYLTASERKLFKTLNVGISHCPNSNFSLQSGVCNVRRLFQEGIQKVGLGTDVGGGYSPSILGTHFLFEYQRVDAMRQAIIASKVIHIQDNEYAPLNISEAFYLATLGGSKVLNMDKKIGNFVVGKSFDALLIDLHDASKDRNSIDSFTHDTTLSLFEKFIYLGDDRNIKQVFVNGEKVISID